MSVSDEFGFVTKGRIDRAKYVPRQAPVLSSGLLATVRKAVEDHIKQEVDRILAERRGQIAYQLEGIMPGQSGPDIRQIILTICDVTNIDLGAFLGPRRSRNVAYPRHLAAWVFKKCRSDLSYPTIAKAMGGRDHTTIMANIRRFEELRDEDPFVQWLADPRIIALLHWNAAK